MNRSWRINIWLGLTAILFSLMSCVNRDETVSSALNRPPSDAQLSSLPPLVLELFSTDELFAAGGDGCGMTLLPQAGELPNVRNPAGMLLFHGIDQPMRMKINQALVEFELEDSQGEAFYGQKTQQTFSNADLNLIVDIQVNLGEVGESESIAIPNATVRLRRKAGADIQDIEAIAVFGDAGC